ncbi:hemolysin III family protein [Arenibacter sp. GZD96]|uniref:PAQR family membrane homeostasis protein TrhA n=1 Tax=Aurantibrevibacter litoralis TaxID=3106030 RepID=UPI002AFE8FB9|nr:hemolysin III family protein [Arenibacter sp. GZD-96]MEA1785969.1 hemolysin III family protein [Arenibacter sp. GZD-96]
MEKQSKKEELWNTLSHAVGAVLGLVGLVLLLLFNEHKTPYSTFSILVYAFSLILLFSTSAIYHWVNDYRLKLLWRKMDHIGIYVLIAGTYTPVALITLEKNNGWLLFWTVWGIAGMGSILKLFFTGRFEKLSLFLYLFMGWLIVFDIHNLVTAVSRFGLVFLILGGAFYTLGTLFYAVRKIPYNHVIWHFFVLGGAISHYIFILGAVI